MLSNWRSRAPELTDWILRDRVNQTNIWGRRFPKSQCESAKQKVSGFQGNAVTASLWDERGKVLLATSSPERDSKAIGRDALDRHRSARVGTWHWFAIDIDLHDEEHRPRLRRCDAFEPVQLEREGFDSRSTYLKCSRSNPASPQAVSRGGMVLSIGE